MFIVVILALCLTQAATTGAVGQPQSATAVATSPPALSGSEVSQLKTRAAAGDAEAQVKLGRAYQDGNGVPQNDDVAVKWYRKAAEQGNPAAQNNLGVMYRLGSGVEKNKEEAVNWYRKAARQNYAPAMFNLGTAYYNGDGVAIDDILAGAWFLLAQKNGSQQADDAVTRMTKDLTAYEVTETYVKIAEILRKGDELPRDDGEAAAWYRKAADSGSALASVELAQQLVQGQGVPQDYPEARSRCEYAAKLQFGPGAYCLGILNREGLGGPKNLPDAAKWFERAAELRDYRGILYLGEMYWKGDGVKVDRDRAYMWIWIAANSGVPGASQDEQLLRQELDPKTVEKARKKATLWAQQHRQLGVRSRNNP